MKLIKNLSLLGLGIFGITVMAAEKAPASKWTPFFELTTSWTKITGKVNDPHFGNSLYASLGYTIDANNALGVETSHVISYTGDASLSHKYMRFYLDQKNTFALKGWATALRWRWYAPTENGTHQAGGWGRFGIRPQVTRSWGAFSLTALDLVQIHLTNQSFQKYTAKRAAPKGVDLFVNALEVVPAYNLTKNLSLSWDGTLATIFTGRTNGTDSNVASQLSHETALTLDSKALTQYADYVAISVSHESPLKNFAYYSKATQYNLKIGKAF